MRTESLQRGKCRKNGEFWKPKENEQEKRKRERERQRMKMEGILWRARAQGTTEIYMLNIY